MSDEQKVSFTKKDRSKKLNFKKSNSFNPDKLKQKEQRYIKHNRRQKLDLLKVDELAVFDEFDDLEESDNSDELVEN